MNYHAKPAIVAVISEAGGTFAAHMLDGVGAFDAPELDDVWDHDEVWVSMVMSLRDFYSAVKQRAPLQYTVPNQRVFATVRRVTEVVCSMVCQSFFVKIDNVQHSGDLAVAKLLVSMLSQREFDRPTIIGFLVAFSKVLGESNMLIRELEYAKSRHNITAEAVSGIILEYSKGSMASAVTSSEAFISGGI